MVMREDTSSHTYGTHSYVLHPNPERAQHQLRWRAPARHDPDPHYLGGRGGARGGHQLLNWRVQQTISVANTASQNPTTNHHLLKKCGEINTKAYKVNKYHLCA